VSLGCPLSVFNKNFTLKQISSGELEVYFPPNRRRSINFSSFYSNKQTKQTNKVLRDTRPEKQDSDTRDSVSPPPKHQEVFQVTICPPTQTWKLKLHHHVNKPTWRFFFFYSNTNYKSPPPCLPPKVLITPWPGQGGYQSPRLITDRNGESHVAHATADKSNNNQPTSHLI